MLSIPVIGTARIFSADSKCRASRGALRGAVKNSQNCGNFIYVILWKRNTTLIFKICTF